jgi:hypothetical protein
MKTIAFIACLALTGCQSIPWKVEACGDQYGVKVCGGYSSGDGAFIRLQKSGSK